MKIDDAVILEEKKRFNHVNWHKQEHQLTMRYEDLKTTVTSAVVGTASMAWVLSDMSAKYFSDYQGRLDVIVGAVGALALAVAYGAAKSYRNRTKILERIGSTSVASIPHYYSCKKTPSNT